MTDLIQFLVFIGMLIIILGVCWCLYHFYFKKDVTMVHDGYRGIMTAGGLLMLLVICGCYGYVLWHGNAVLMQSIAMLLISLFIFYIIIWLFVTFDGMRRRYMELLETLISVLEAGDSNMDGHSLHVYNLVMLLFEYLPYEMKSRLNEGNLKYAALLFDIGKYGIPGRILNKSGKLEGSDWELMKRHPEICVRILEPIGDFKMISDWILYHHERIDGKGYYGMKGDKIPLASRMIALADTYSSITMARSYKPTLTYEDAIAELKLAAGTQLDQNLVNIFCQIPMQKVEDCMFDVMKKMGGYHEQIFGKQDKKTV